ncbi:hypothetical protein AMJ57_01500 [Parcubacteria bacterium SG8_24]|nr:MAG: hypothetical protein AMJ57_01500 [Parcubacteria bacterium SG8_24]
MMWLLVWTALLLGVMLYQSLPETMASHWNSRGEVDGYMPRFWGVFLMPSVMALMAGLFMVIPKIDPLKKNLKRFMGHYAAFVLVLLGFLLYVHSLTLLWNLGVRFNMTITIVPAIAALFYFIGDVLRQAKRNWFLGIRTPWTLSSDRVWDKTHLLGARLYKASALITIAGLLVPRHAIWFLLLPVMATTVVLIVYSYLLYRQEERHDT